MTARNVIACPGSTAHPALASEGRRCETMLQRSAEGDLIDGVALHLRTVHELQPAVAVSIARAWVRQQR
jgi:hypothetical protein